MLANESGDAVVGGRDTITAFRGNQERWRVRHKAPDRGAFRIVAGIALRATALYFRYGGFATSAIGFAQSGLSLARTVNRCDGGIKVAVRGDGPATLAELGAQLC